MGLTHTLWMRSPSYYQVWLHLGIVENFVGALEQGREPLVTVGECRRSLELATALYRSAMTGERVSLPIEKTDPFYSCIPPEGMALRGTA